MFNYFVITVISRDWCNSQSALKGHERLNPHPISASAASASRVSSNRRPPSSSTRQSPWVIPRSRIQRRVSLSLYNYHYLLLPHAPCPNLTKVGSADCFFLGSLDLLWMQARLRSESTVSLSPPPHATLFPLLELVRSDLSCAFSLRLRPRPLRLRKDRQARGQGRPPERGCRARRRQRPLHHHGLHGTRLDLLRLFRAMSRSGAVRGVCAGFTIDAS